MAERQESRLKRNLTFWNLMGVAIGQIIGAGIMTMTGTAIGMTGTGVALAFMISPVLTLITDFPQGILSSCAPAVGGPYKYVSRLLDKRFGLLYIVLFIIGTFTIYISDLNQGLIFPAGLYVIGAYNLGVMCFPNLLEKWIKLKNIDAKESLIFNNFILNLQQMKSVILMFVLSSAILLTMMCTNLDDLQYMILFQLGYVLTNIVLSFTLINRFRINQINKKQYYRNLSRLGLNYEEIRYMTKKEKTLMYEMIAVLSLVYLSNLNIAFVYLDKMGVLSALFLILELIIPLFISYRVAVYQEEMRIRKWKK